MTTQTKDLLANATPRPWHVNDGPNKDYVLGKDGCHVARTAVDTDQEAEANAAIIVLAVNEYEALLAVAEAAELAVKITRDGINPENDGARLVHARHVLNEALANLAALRKEQR